MIKVQNAIKKFDKFTAIDNLTCGIPEGCIYGMVGSNGAGKSTFLRVLSGVYKLDSGICELDGEPIWENPSVKRKLAFVPDDVYYLPNSSMNRMAELYEAIYPDFDRNTYKYLTANFGLDPQKSLSTFSKGMRRQASLILVLAAKPKYIFLDETFDGLDHVMRSYVKKLICSDVMERNATVIITSHSLRELEDTCDQLSLLHKGGLVLENDIQNLKTRQYKIQIAFADDYDMDKFKDLDIVSFEKTGSVTNMIIKNDREEAIAKLSALCPLILEILPLSLEEIFTYEMDALGYSFDDMFTEV